MCDNLFLDHEQELKILSDLHGDFKLRKRDFVYKEGFYKKYKALLHEVSLDILKKKLEKYLVTYSELDLDLNKNTIHEFIFSIFMDSLEEPHCFHVDESGFRCKTPRKMIYFCAYHFDQLTVRQCECIIIKEAPNKDIGYATFSRCKSKALKQNSCCFNHSPSENRIIIERLRERFKSLRGVCDREITKRCYRGQSFSSYIFFEDYVKWKDKPQKPQSFKNPQKPQAPQPPNPHNKKRKIHLGARHRNTNLLLDLSRLEKNFVSRF